MMLCVSNCLLLFSAELNMEMQHVIVVHTVAFSLESGFDSEGQSP